MRTIPWFSSSSFYKRPLSKLHSIVKTAFFGIFFDKFFDHMFTYALEIYQKILPKMARFSNQSEFRKKSKELRLGSAPHYDLR